MKDFRLPDARGWIGIGSFTLTVMVLWMVKEDATLRQDEFFKVLATLIVGGFVKDVLGWAYQATKSGGELADRNADLVQQVAQTTANSAAKANDEPRKVIVANTKENPAKVEETKPGDDELELRPEDRINA